MGRLARHLHLNVCGDIRVELETDTLRPGDTVVGVVILRVSKPIPCAQLRIWIRGKQTLLWWISIDEIRIPQWRKHHHLAHTKALVKHDAMFLPGELRYPFTFSLPKTEIPPSLLFKRCKLANLENVRARVKYSVDATLLVHSATTADLCTSTPFTVEQPPPRALGEGEPVVASRETVVKILGMANRGTCGLSMQLPSNVLDAATTVEAVATTEIRTNRRLKYIKLALYQDATIDRHTTCRFLPHGLKQGTRIVCSRRFEPAAPGLGVCGSPEKIVLHLPLSPLDKPKCDVLLPTLQAHYLTIGYHVTVECHFAWAKTARVSVPVTIISGCPEPVAA